jgi:hypothetical protein
VVGAQEAALTFIGSRAITVSPAKALRGHDLRRDAGAPARVGVLNLGEGFPDEDGPLIMVKIAENAMAEASTSTRRRRASPPCGSRSPPNANGTTARGRTWSAVLDLWRADLRVRSYCDLLGR